MKQNRQRDKPVSELAAREIVANANTVIHERNKFNKKVRDRR